MEKAKFQQPYFVAVWPGIGQVAINAGIYLLSKLGMSVVGELQADELFDIEQITVEQGRIELPRRPRHRFFAWTDPRGEHDLIVFLGEAQPPHGRYSMAEQLVRFARELGVVKVFTFAAMAAEMRPDEPSGVLFATTDEAFLESLKARGLRLLKEGNIGGMNGILPAAAAVHGLPGTCLLGEMPHLFHNFPYPKASLAILEAFSEISGYTIDLAGLIEQARAVDLELAEIWKRLQEAHQERRPTTEDESESHQLEPAVEEQLTSAERRQIESLFQQAAQDRGKAFELKQELDRLGVFEEFEDRFLDLFKNPS